MKTINFCEELTHVQKNLFDSEQLITVQNGKAVTSSLQVAMYFEKNHQNVLRNIRKIECSQNFKELNFEFSFYIRELDKRGQHKYPMYYMTKDGFTFLVMGFTGKAASKFKEEYINAFNKMEALLQGQQVNEKQISDLVATHINEPNNLFKQYSKELSKKFNLPLLTPDMINFKWNEKDSLYKNIENLLISYRYNSACALYSFYSAYKRDKENQEIRKFLHDFIHKAYSDYEIFPC